MLATSNQQTIVIFADQIKISQKLMKFVIIMTFPRLLHLNFIMETPKLISCVLHVASMQFLYTTLLNNRSLHCGAGTFMSLIIVHSATSN